MSKTWLVLEMGMKKLKEEVRVLEEVLLVLMSSRQQ
jgi:hypothetical protein